MDRTVRENLEDFGDVVGHADVKVTFLAIVLDCEANEFGCCIVDLHNVTCVDEGGNEVLLVCLEMVLDSEIVHYETKFDLLFDVTVDAWDEGVLEVTTVCKNLHGLAWQDHKDVQVDRERLQHCSQGQLVLLILQVLAFRQLGLELVHPLMRRLQ